MFAYRHKKEWELLSSVPLTEASRIAQSCRTDNVEAHPDMQTYT